MKRLVYIVFLVVLVSGCRQQADAPPSDHLLARSIVGHWESTYLEIEGTPISNTVGTVQFLPDGTWEAQVPARMGTDDYRDRYTVSGTQITMFSSRDGENAAGDSYILTNGLLKSTAKTHVTIMKRKTSQNQCADYCRIGAKV